MQLAAPTTGPRGRGMVGTPGGASNAPGRVTGPYRFLVHTATRVPWVHRWHTAGVSTAHACRAQRRGTGPWAQGPCSAVGDVVPEDNIAG